MEAKLASSNAALGPMVDPGAVVLSCAFPGIDGAGVGCCCAREYGVDAGAAVVVWSGM